MARDSYREYLASVPLFAHCNGKQLDHVSRLATEIRVPAGNAFVRQGEPGQEMFVVLEGTAEVTRDGVAVAQLGRGDVVGELAVLRHATRNATVTATSEVSVLVVAARDVSDLLDEINGFAKALLLAVLNRLDDDGRPTPA